MIMRRTFLNAFTLAICLFSLTPLAHAANVSTPIDGSYKLIFDEEFNGKALDQNKWTPTWYADANGNSLPVNSAELQNYSPDQVTVGGGNLHLNLIQKPLTVSGVTRQYTSGFIQSRGKFQTSYSYVEARVFLPGTAGQVANWPALWMVGQGNWPTTGEIDIMEGLGGQAMQTFHSNQGQMQAIPKGDFTGWHIFAAHWEAGKIRCFYDGQLIGTLTNGITADPEVLLVNLATGAYGGPISAPSEMLVDYIHVYSNQTGAVAVTPQACYGGAGDLGPSVPCDGSVAVPVTPPVVIPPVIPPVIVTPPADASAFAISSPALSANVSGIVNVVGTVGANFKNIAAFDLNNNYAKVSPDVAPAAGKFFLAIDTNKLSNGVHKIAVIAFSTSAGLSGGTSAEVDLNLTIANVVVAPNLIVNPGFETSLANWSSYGNVAIVTSGAHAGARAAQIRGGAAGIEQTIRGLSPNTNYVLKAYVRQISGAASAIGVKDFGGAQVTASASPNAYAQISLSFKTGASSTSAKIFFYNGGGAGLVDDFSLTKP